MSFTRPLHANNLARLLLEPGLCSVCLITMLVLLVSGGGKAAQGQGLLSQKTETQEQTVPQVETRPPENTELESSLSDFSFPESSVNQEGSSAPFLLELPLADFTSYLSSEIKVEFYCGSGDFPETTVVIEDGSAIEFTFLEWTKDFYPETNETSLERCASTASIFQEYLHENSLDRIVATLVDGTPAICVSEISSSSCGRVILKLEEGENVGKVVDALSKSLIGIAFFATLDSDDFNMSDFVSTLNLPSAVGEMAEEELEHLMLNRLKEHYIQEINSNLQVVNGSENFSTIDDETVNSLVIRSGFSYRVLRQFTDRRPSRNHSGGGVR